MGIVGGGRVGLFIWGGINRKKVRRVEGEKVGGWLGAERVGPYI